MMVPREQQAAQVDYTVPLIPEAAGIVVTGPTAPPIAKLDDLSGQEVYVRENTGIWDKLAEFRVCSMTTWPRG